MRDLIGKQKRGSIGTRPGLQVNRGKSPHVDGLAPRGRSIEAFRADRNALQHLAADPSTDLFAPIAQGDGQIIPQKRCSSRAAIRSAWGSWSSLAGSSGRGLLVNTRIDCRHKMQAD